MLDYFSEPTAPMLNKMETNKSENRDLATLRDALLPKLIFRELRLLEAEKQRLGTA